MESQPQNPEFRNNPENFNPCIYPANNVKIVCIYKTFMSRINFMLSCVKHKKCFITSKPGKV